MSAAPRLICQRTRNRKFHLGARAQLAPEIKMSTDSLCSLAHAWYAEVPWLSAGP
jgi:hypothetical protein